MKELALDDYRTLYVAKSLNQYVLVYKNTRNGIVAPLTFDMSSRLLGKSYPYVFPTIELAKETLNIIAEDKK